MAVHIKEDCDDPMWAVHHITEPIKKNWFAWCMESKDPRFEEVYRSALRFESPYVVDSFFRFIEFDDKRKFYEPRQEYLKPIIASYQDLYDGKLDLLAISQPKRTGKTSSALRLVSMFSGRHPENGTLATGRGESLVNVFYTGCNDIIDTQNYKEVFPASPKVKTNADNMTIDLQKRHMFPTIQCRPIDGAIVGSTEARNLLYIDDPVEGHQEALNRGRLDSLNEKIKGDILGRRIEGTPILIQGTRYSIYDPIGTLIDVARALDWRYRIVAIPALDPKTDESNFECVIDGKWKFTTKYFRGERKIVTPFQWASEFQQEPFEEKGRVFPEEDLRRFFELPKDKDGNLIPPDAIIAACDTAESGEDSTSCPIGYMYGNDVYIPDVVWDDSMPEVTKPELAKKLVDHHVVQARFESNNAGTYFARDVDELVKKAGGFCSITTKRSISNKVTRIEFASDNIIKNFLFLDKSKYQPGSQYWGFMREVTQFTKTGKVKHDDAPDSLAMLENFIRETKTVKAVVLDRSILGL